MVTATRTAEPDSLPVMHRKASSLRARLAKQDPAAFRSFLRIDADGTPKLLGENLDPWQRQDFEALDPGWKWMAGISDVPAKTCGYFERPRGHSKTTDEGASALWALYAAPRLIRGYAAASDRDQAGLIRDAIDGMVRINPWIAETIQVDNNQVVNTETGSILKIISSDAPSSYGYTPDFVIVDELTHWKKRDLWDSLFSATAKRERCLCVVIANAGMGMDSSWQWFEREQSRLDPDWVFHRLEGPIASWISKNKLEKQSRRLPLSAYRRLWLNLWTAGEGDALDPEDIEAAITMPGPMLNREHHNRIRRVGAGEWSFAAGLDLGVNHDHAALVVLASQFGSPRIRLAYCQSWKPPKGGQVDLEAVMNGVADAHERFFLQKVCYDPHEAALMAQLLQRKHALLMEPMNFVGKNLNLMATAILSSFRTRSIDLYKCPELLRDLRRLTIMEKPWGFKLESAQTEDGHADTAIAMACVLPFAQQMAHRGAFEHHGPEARRAEKPAPKGMQFQRGGRNGHRRGMQYEKK